MDRNQITGLILISLLLFTYYYFFAPKPKPVTPEENPVEETRENPVVIPQQKEPSEETGPETKEELPAIDTLMTTGSGPFAALFKGEEEEIVLENNVIRYTFSTKGGQVKRILLKKFKTYYKEPLVLLDEKSSTIREEIDTKDGRIDLNEMYYEPTYSSTTVNGRDTISIQFRASTREGSYIQKTYRIPGDGYTLIQKISLENINDQLTSGSVMFVWDNNLKSFEKDLKTSRMKSTINYYKSAGDFDNLRESSSDVQEETLAEPVSWVSFKQKFFTTAIIPNKPIRGVYIQTNPEPFDPNVVKSCVVKATIPVQDFENGYEYYYGPNNYQILKKVTDGFSRNIYLGWTPVNWVNKFLIIPTFHFLERFISNYGIIIILLVVFIKILLFPLTYKSYISMAKTKVLKPELDAIKEQYGGEMQKVQSEQMKLYRQVGVNPLSGCVPMLLQMPILFSMFYFFPNSIELRQESFLWADDLSTFDSIMHLPFNIPAYGDHVSLFTLLMTASTILYTWSNNQVSTVQGPMKSMQYFMPVVFMFVLNSFPAALSFYYFISNLVTFGQQAFIRRFVDDEKIKKILDENRMKSSTKKKSKFQQRLEEAMKASDETKKHKRKRY